MCECVRKVVRVSRGYAQIKDQGQDTESQVK